MQSKVFLPNSIGLRQSQMCYDLLPKCFVLSCLCMSRKSGQWVTSVSAGGGGDGDRKQHGWMEVGAHGVTHVMDAAGEMSDTSYAGKYPRNSSDLSLGSTGELCPSCSSPLDPHPQAEVYLDTEQLCL